MSDVPGAGEGQGEGLGDPLHFDTPQERDEFLGRLLAEVRAYEAENGLGSYAFADDETAGLFEEALEDTDPDAAEIRSLTMAFDSPDSETVERTENVLDRVFPEGAVTTDEPEEVVDAGFWTIPNAITLARMAYTERLVRQLESDPARYGPKAIAVALSDNADGILARWLNQTSEFGRRLDPVADVYLSSRMAWVLDRAGVIPRALTAATLAQKATKSAVVVTAAAQVGDAKTEVTKLGKYSEFATNTGVAGLMLSERIQDTAKRKIARGASVALMATGIVLGFANARELNEQRKGLVRDKKVSEIADAIEHLAHPSQPGVTTREEEGLPLAHSVEFEDGDNRFVLQHMLNAETSEEGQVALRASVLKMSPGSRAVGYEIFSDGSMRRVLRGDYSYELELSEIDLGTVSDLHKQITSYTE